VRIITRLTLLCGVTAAVAVNSGAQLPPETASRIDSAVAKVMEETAVPSVSLAVIKDGKIAYVHAYGSASLDPATPARPEMRYCLGSVSKQFMAMAILLLVQDGKLKLDDPVVKHLPALTRAKDITIRQLLSHTSGYQDYYPLDYVAPFMTVPVTPDQILDRFARIPLDFEPGTEWQYSNTNFVAAGRILEKVTGAPLMSFLQKTHLSTAGNRERHRFGCAVLGGFRRQGLYALWAWAGSGCAAGGAWLAVRGRRIGYDGAGFGSLGLGPDGWETCKTCIDG
jgi:CubicO group peptidase (beta-lactamase class C family)